MDEQRQLLFVSTFLPSNEQKLIDRLREAATRRITRPAEVTAALRDVSSDSIADIAVGSSYVGVLYTDGQVGRFPYVATSRPLAPSASPTKSTPPVAAPVSVSGGSGGPGGGPSGGGGGGPPGAPSGGAAGGTSAHPSLIARTAKFRRVMLATSGRRDHRSVIIDRARPMLPASAVPEDLIAQAQVVLQGKSREVIVRELQRTNLNVNEAVNNLLSRDDDDDDGSEGAEMCIPEELLSLLDSSHGGSILESELYGGDSFEYLLSSRERRGKAEKEKDKQKSTKPSIESNSDTEALRRYEIPGGSISEPWEGLEDDKETAKFGLRFTKIACTHSELLAVSTDGKLHGWKWCEEAGERNVHVMYEKLKLEDGEIITHLSASSLRVAVMTSSGRMATWLDNVACGERLCEALFVPPQKLNVAVPDSIEQLVVSNHLAVATFPSNLFFWCGFYPVNERRRLFEKARSRLRKHVTFDTTQIVEGSEVRTKSGPIYSIGCIAANLAGPTPMIGILMENAWSLSEMCRFRLLDPAAYDNDRFEEGAAAAAEEDEEGKEAAIAQQALASGSRKRPAAEDVFNTTEPKQREEPWLISDVIFIHEEVQNDTAIVRIVDGGYCAVEYQKVTSCPSDAFATPLSKKLARTGDKEKPQQKMRLIRKDELTVVTQKMRFARSPNSVRSEPYRFVLSGSTSTKKVISAVADSLGIRALVERRGAASIMRVSVCGKILTSHSLPLHAPSLYSSDGSGKPTLINYGDDSILLLRDAHGGIIPLVRDASAGFREPSYLQLPASSITAVTVKNIVQEKDRPSWAPKSNREAVIVSMLGTHPRTLERRLPSLLYCVQSCDEKAVKAVLDALEKEDDLELSKREIVDTKTDGNRHALHVAVMNAFATKNSLEADVETPLSVLTTSESRSAAEQARLTLDKKWNEMLKTRSANRASASASTASTASSTSTAVGMPEVLSAPALPSALPPLDIPMDIVIVPESQVPTAVIKVEVEDENSLIISPTPIENPKQRQESSIAIVKMLVTHPVCMQFSADVLSARDIHGQTPFMAAVNNRAYSAARSIFNAVVAYVESETGKMDNADELIPFIFPSGCRPDDSPLFILCYNDTCSFTWTGDEHINQDIFECRTCGLTGSLCCCTECAFTCHRNHDCKLKRTSPTAYCDCWEKACCKALVTGNQHARENLLMGLISKSNLYTMLNGRGEHVLLYLARKLARQSSEQWNYTRRPRRIQAPSSARDTSIPEHDLDPPRFARTALLYCLRNWNVVKSLAMIGVRRIDHSLPISEEMFHLNAQNGSSHLDKFMLIMLTKCSDESMIVLETLLRVLSETHNKARATGDNLEEVNMVISRFVRSVARLFILAVIISSVAASTAVSGVVPSKDAGLSSSSSLVDRSSLRGMTFSGIFGHLRKDTGKDSKLKNMGAFIVRCKMFFEHFALFTIHEMSQLADASLAPVRTGIVRPCVSLPVLLGASADSIESLEKYINSEPDVTQTMCKMDLDSYDHPEDRRETRKRRKRTSRRDTDREEPTSEGLGQGGGGGGGAPPLPPSQPTTERESSAESDLSDSDSDGDGPSSRRITSQSSALAANEEPTANEETTRRSQPDEEYSSDGDDEEESESEGDGRDDDEDEEEEEEDEEMERDERDEPMGEEDAEMDYVTSEGEAPTSTAGEENRRREEGEEREEERNEGGLEEERERRREERRGPPAIGGGEEESAGRYSASSPDDEMEAFEDFVIDSADRSRSPSSPEYSSGEEGGGGAGAERRMAVRRLARAEAALSRARRRKPAAAAAAADGSAAAAAGEAGREGGGEQAGEVGRQGDLLAVDSSSRDNLDSIADSDPLELRRSDSTMAIRTGGIPAEGAARTRPEDPRRPSTAVSSRSDGTPVTSGGNTESSDSRGYGRRSDRRLMWSGDRLGGRRNATADASRPRTGSSAAAGSNWTYRRPELPPWISRTSDAERRARGSISATTGGVTSDDKKTEVSCSTKEDEMPTTTKASIQLATAFSFAVRIIGEMMPLVATTPKSETSCNPLSSRPLAFRDVDKLSEMEESVRKRTFELVCTRLDDSWKWLAIVLDHVEAQIKYINAVSATDTSKKKDGKERRKGGMKKKNSNVTDDSTAPVSSSTSSTSPLSLSKVRRETMSCLLGVLRAHSGEAGDDTPLIHLETLRAPALVVDAYLGFIEAKADTEKLFELSKKKEESSILVLAPEVEEEIRGVRGFYQRSNSVSFPGVSFSDAHDTLQLSCMQSLPIVERPQLLTSTVEKEVLFGPSSSTQERTKEEHDKVIRSHGIAHSHNQSLTAAPISSHQLFCGDEGDQPTPPAVTVPLSSVASAPAALNDMVEETKEKKTPPSRGKKGKKRGGRSGEVKQSPSNDVIMEEVEVVEIVQPPQGFEKVTYEEILDSFNIFREHPLRKLMGRWRYALQLIAKELHADLTDTLGGELSGSRLLRELAGFEMKQHELRARMEKYRAGATKDVNIEVHRDPASLIRETCYQLNRTFTRRVAMRGTENRSSSLANPKKDEALPPLASHKVKVKFRDEPGEGTGVARSYYTALAEALVSLKQLPFTDYGYNSTNDEYLYGGPISGAPSAAPATGGSGTSSSARRIQLIRGRESFYATVTSMTSGGRRKVSPYDRRLALNFLHPPYTPADMKEAEDLNLTQECLLDLREEMYTRREGADKLPAELSDRLFILIRNMYPTAAARLTGMFMDLPLANILLILADPPTLKAYLGDAIDQMMTNAAPSDIVLLRGEEETSDLPSTIISTEADDAPLFFRPSKKAHYSPVPGRLSPARISAFRNIGRVMGLCLMQCEMFPLRLSRHVLKYILGRPLNWHDFAFYDPQMFESLRKLIVDGCCAPDHQQFFDDLQMTFCTQPPPESTGVPSATIDLVPGGSEILVTKDNVIEYVYRFVEARLLGTSNGRCLAAMRQGVQDVIPQALLDNLSAEDLRLVLCGTETVSLSLMQSYTAWTDESHAVPETIAKYKQWFWQVADRLSPQEKQDLIFFWTGAPSLPSTEEGFQPLPTIVIRPSDDGFLPTANTCISRLYLPLYNSKRILSSKLQLAIKAKNFGFV